MFTTPTQLDMMASAIESYKVQSTTMRGTELEILRYIVRKPVEPEHDQMYTYTWHVKGT